MSPHDALQVFLFQGHRESAFAYSFPRQALAQCQLKCSKIRTESSGLRPVIERLEESERSEFGIDYLREEMRREGVSGMGDAT
ncbi:uncharacterized protein ARMOST_07873 [Armillaria ostoyae]|uniref:Uncharacterized protein n=1 Tax=Armillaria ostoyae TaxID=47428 RepID=A0A284R711_ARMOS|nr:uncharacterized protein ARMOST_07873 [Armillaria ostoyae]